MPAPARIEWSDEFAVLDADSPVAELLPLLAENGPYYIVLRRAWDLLYVFISEELARRPEIARYRFVEPPPGLSVFEELELHEHDSSRLTPRDGTPLPHPYDVPGGFRALPSRERFVAVDDAGQPIAVGEDAENLTLGGGRQPHRIGPGPMGLTHAAPPPGVGGEPGERDFRPRGTGKARDTVGGAAPQPAAAPAPDEGTDPVRYPSILSDRELTPGRPVVITVDLLQQRTDLDTLSAGVSVSGLPQDWHEVEVEVQLVSSAIDFASSSGTVRLRRNAASLPALFEGRVRADLEAGQQAVVAAFFSHAGRDCGSARRSFTIGAPATETAAEQGGAMLVVETGATAPALTVRIIRPEPSAPGKLIWSLHVPRADEVPGLPGRLYDLVDLGADPVTWVTELYRRSESAVVGTHEKLFQGIGDELWQRTPACFQRAYWALRAALGPGFPIQFVTDDPYVPWELVRPYDEGSDQVADILALEHPVARWIADYEGSLRQRLPRGRVVTIAPNYRSVADQLPRAQEEAELLTREHAAKAVPGTTVDVTRLLEDGLADETVAILHFAGHGDFLPQQPSASSIKLEDGSLPAVMVGRREVRLGERDGPLVVFNACKVGATGASLGGSGGWAEVFLRRRFRGVVAPLWKVYDDDAPVVVKELFDAVVRRGETLGSALQQIRARHRASSPTFFAYLYYGDVMARMPLLEGGPAPTREGTRSGRSFRG